MVPGRSSACGPWPRPWRPRRRRRPRSPGPCRSPPPSRARPCRQRCDSSPRTDANRRVGEPPEIDRLSRPPAHPSPSVLGDPAAAGGVTGAGANAVSVGHRSTAAVRCPVATLVAPRAALGIPRLGVSAAPRIVARPPSAAGSAGVTSASAEEVWGGGRGCRSSSGRTWTVPHRRFASLIVSIAGCNGDGGNGDDGGQHDVERHCGRGRGRRDGRPAASFSARPRRRSPRT